MRISDWSSDVCSSDLGRGSGCQCGGCQGPADRRSCQCLCQPARGPVSSQSVPNRVRVAAANPLANLSTVSARRVAPVPSRQCKCRRSEEHTSELQSLMRNSYAVFCLKKKTSPLTHVTQHNKRIYRQLMK